MNHLVRLAVFVLALTALAACKYIPFTGPGCLILTVHGVELDDVASIYLIVGSESELKELDSEKTIDKVVEPGRANKYVTFGQFGPKPGSVRVLQQLVLKPNNKWVEVSLAKEDPELRVEIHRELLESHEDLMAVVVVRCRSQGWGASQRISSSEIRTIDTMELDLRGTAITIREKSGGSKLPSFEVPK